MSASTFRFRLERVRAVRERKEKLAQRELATRSRAARAASPSCARADAHLEHALEEQRTVGGEREAVSANDLVARQAFLERVEAQRRLRARELEQRELEVAERDAELATAASEHEMLNRLRDRHRGEHDREADRRERNVLDEIASTRFRRSTA